MDASVVDDAHHAITPRWRKSSLCTGGNCVEVASLPEGIGVRGSEDGPVLVFTHEEWCDFLAGAALGEFSNLA